jgi:hypothetical protein
MHFGQAPRFEILADGTIIARAGTQTNCGGIAKIHIRITARSDGMLTFGPDFDVSWTGDRYGSAVPGCAVPEEYRQAIFRGARSAFDHCDARIGAHFELIDALVHPVDARESRFGQAAFQAMKGWLDLNFPGCWKEDAEEQASTQEV